MTDFERLLDALGIAPGERVSVCHRLPGEEAFTATLGTAADAPARARPFVERADVWFGVNPLREEVATGRGVTGDQTRLAALYADLDVKPGGLPTRAACEAVVSDLEGLLEAPVTALVASSGEAGGLHAYWRVEDDGADLARSAAALARFGLLTAAVATARGGSVDNTFDLPRVLRVPGTSNWKNPEAPAPVELVRCVTTEPLDLAQVTEQLDAYGVAEADAAADISGDPVSPRKDWKPADATCPYARAMVAGWESDTPAGGRHGWFVGQAVRLLAAYRYGCLSKADAEAAGDTLKAAFVRLLATAPVRKQGRYEVESAFRWARLYVERMSAEAVAAELGGHTHAPARRPAGGARVPGAGLAGRRPRDVAALVRPALRPSVPRRRARGGGGRPA